MQTKIDFWWANTDTDSPNNVEISDYDSNDSFFRISGRQHVRDVDVNSGDDPSLETVNCETLL